MKFQNGSKRFLTLNPNNSEGFTLVELIVVIAIIAILAGVAVPAYSGYVTKANKQADISLASEVRDALILNYYNNMGENADGYVVLTPEGKLCVYDEVGEKAMDAVFGDGWEETLSLKYDGWVAEATGSAVTSVDAKSITSTVGSLTNLASAATAANNDETIKNVLSAFCNLSGEQTEELANYKGQENYDTIATNLMVKYLADEISANKWTYDSDQMNFVTSEGQAMSSGANYAMQYAMLYAMANSNSEYSSQATTQLANFNDELAAIVAAEQENSDASSVTDALDEAFYGLYFTELEDGEGNTIGFVNVFQEYINNNTADVSDITAALGAMSDMAADYNDLETLSNGGLFSGAAMTNAIAAYQLAAANGGIAIQITNGVCYTMPKLS